MSIFDLFNRSNVRPHSVVPVTAATDYPLTVAEAKEHCRVHSSFSADDSYFGALIAVATEYAEDYTQRALESQVWDAVYNHFPVGRSALIIPKPPLASVESITYLDEDEAEQEVDADIYRVVYGKDPGQVVILADEMWPCTAGVSDAVRVRFTCGYGAITGRTVPEGIRHGMLVLINELYELRADTVLGLNVTKLKTIENLMRKEKVELF